jgi:hypothetical protein
MLDMQQKSPSQQAFEKTWIYKAGQDDQSPEDLSLTVQIPKYKAMFGKYWKQMYAAQMQQLAMQQMQTNAAEQPMGSGESGGILNWINPYLFPNT